MREADISILVIDENPDRAGVIERGLVEAGYVRVSRIGVSGALVDRLQAAAPDVIIIDLENPDRGTLEQMFQVSRAVCRPIAMLVDFAGGEGADGAMVREAVEAGVAAYVVDRLRQERIKPIVEMAISRFAAFDGLRRERDDAHARLADRKVIDRAKGLLMKRKGLAEEDAYALLRRTAMQQNRKLVDIAQSVITAFEMDI
jgi:response regulator NasT